jgi:maltose/moltooligosaccharide transporter
MPSLVERAGRRYQRRGRAGGHAHSLHGAPLWLRVSHLINLSLGARGIARPSLDPRIPMVADLSMVGVGFAWGSILSLPYALLAGSVPSRKMGVYMGIFNFFIVIPQIVATARSAAYSRTCCYGRRPCTCWCWAA